MTFKVYQLYGIGKIEKTITGISKLIRFFKSSTQLHSSLFKLLCSKTHVFSFSKSIFFFQQFLMAPKGPER